MLVRCTSCNKPVFVSSSLVASGEAKVACKACNVELLVTPKGDVRAAAGDATHAPAAPPPAAVPAIAPPAAPAMSAPEAAEVQTAPSASPDSGTSNTPWNQPTVPATPLQPQFETGPTSAPAEPESFLETTAVTRSPFASSTDKIEISPSPFGEPTAVPVPSAGMAQADSGRPPSVTTPLAWRRTADPNVAYKQPVAQSGMGAPFEPAKPTEAQAIPPGEMPTQVGPPPSMNAGLSPATPTLPPDSVATSPAAPNVGDLSMVDMNDRRETAPMAAVGSDALPTPTEADTWWPAAAEPPAASEPRPPDAPTQVGPAPTAGAHNAALVGDEVPDVAAPTTPSLANTVVPEPAPLAGTNAAAAAPGDTTAVTAAPEIAPETPPPAAAEEPILLADDEAMPIEPLEPVSEAEPLGLPAEAPAASADAVIGAAVAGTQEPSAFQTPTAEIDEPPRIHPKPKRVALYGIAAVVIAIIAGGGAWAFGFVTIPRLKAPFATKGSKAAIGVKPTAKPEEPTKPTPVEPAPVEPTPIEPTPVEPTPPNPTPTGDTPARGGEAPTTDVAVPDDGNSDAAAADDGADDGKNKTPKNKKDHKKPPKKTPSKPAKETKSKEPKSSTKSGTTSTKTQAKAPAPSPAPSPAGDPADAHYVAANGYMKEKKIPLAIEELNKAIAANFKHAKSYRLLGMAYTMVGKEKNAIEAFEKFLKYDPGHSDAPKVRAIVDDYYKRNPK